MTCSNYGTCHPDGTSLLLGTFCGGFGWDKDIFEFCYANKNSLHYLLGHWGAGWDGWRQVALDDMFYN